jgi:hypothetical protein
LLAFCWCVDHMVKKIPILAHCELLWARFVAAGATDLKLCSYVPLCHLTSHTKFRSDLILGLATKGPKLKTQKVL